MKVKLGFTILAMSQCIALVCLVGNTMPTWGTVPIFFALIMGISYFIVRATSWD